MPRRLRTGSVSPSELEGTGSGRERKSQIPRREKAMKAQYSTPADLVSPKGIVWIPGFPCKLSLPGNSEGATLSTYQGVGAVACTASPPKFTWNMANSQYESLTPSERRVLSLSLGVKTSVDGGSCNGCTCEDCPLPFAVGAVLLSVPKSSGDKYKKMYYALADALSLVAIAVSKNPKALLAVRASYALGLWSPEGCTNLEEELRKHSGISNGDDHIDMFKKALRTIMMLL